MITLVFAEVNIAARPSASPDYISNSIKDIPIKPDTSHLAKPNDRAGSIRAIVSHLSLGEGSVIVDIGAGRGRDTWVFAKVVGETGLVFAETMVVREARGERFSFVDCAEQYWRT